MELHQPISRANHTASFSAVVAGNSNVSDETLENLARMEHLRYSRYLTAHGYSYAAEDDDVFKTIQKFQQGRMTKQEAIKELRYAKPNDQIAFCNNTVIRGCLKFVRSYRLEVRG